MDAISGNLVQPPIPACLVARFLPRTPVTMRIRRTTLRTMNRRKKSCGSRRSPSGSPRPIYTMEADGHIPGVVGDYQGTLIAKIKEELSQVVQGINRGIFGVPSEKRLKIEALVKLLESHNPTPEPALNLEKVDGCWKLVYSTVTILGPNRTKLGLRDFITLGDFLQIIRVSEGKAVNMIKFYVRGLNLFDGLLTIRASFKIASKSRVDITYEDSTVTPDQLMKMFRKNYDLLLGIFNPEGWLEISYVDDTLRLGRDDKGNIFILEKDQRGD